MHKCEGCTFRIFLEDAVNAPKMIHMISCEIEDCFGGKLLPYNDGGKWPWVCRYTKHGKQTFRNCPCSGCLIKSTCTEACDKFITLIRTKGDFYKVTDSETSNRKYEIFVRCG
jgi:hypothetical protein